MELVRIPNTNLSNLTAGKLVTQIFMLCKLFKCSERILMIFVIVTPQFHVNSYLTNGARCTEFILLIFVKVVKMITVLNTIDTGHEDMIHDAELDYYGLRLATCSSDNSVKIYDIKSGTQTLAADLKGHFGPVWQVAWAHPKFGNLLASCSYDRKVIIWKEQGEWTKLYEHAVHESSVNSVAWAPAEYGLILACCSSDGSISIISYSQDTGNWDVKKIPGAHAIGVNSVSWCPAISAELNLDPLSNKEAPKRIVSGGCDNLIKVR